MMPLIGRWRLGHRFNIGLVCSLTAGAGLLTVLALRDDRADPHYQAAVIHARNQAHRVTELAQAAGIPPGGALSLLRNDPLTQGPKLFAQNCSSCHRFDGHDGMGGIPKEPPSAPDLKGFASREWIAGLLDPAQISEPHYFGNTKFSDGRMARFVKRDLAKLSAEEMEDLNKIILALSAEAALPVQKFADENQSSLIQEGRKLLVDGALRCSECHQFHSIDEDATGPDLTGYGSREWLIGMISDPAHERFYAARNDRMPSFGRDQTLSSSGIELLADWLRGDWPQPLRAARQ
jgi:ubiquinol-cytochrome c reductase cytochrome b subunit